MSLLRQVANTYGARISIVATSQTSIKSGVKQIEFMIRTHLKDHMLKVKAIFPSLLVNPRTVVLDADGSRIQVARDEIWRDSDVIVVGDLSEL
jgi:lipopolysaccharide biosynthesis glycosyltransferase